MNGGWLGDLLTVYRTAFGRGLSLAARNPVLVVPTLAYFYVPALAMALLAPLGFLAGLILVLLESTCWSAMLACTGDVIRTGRTSMDDVRRGFTTHLWDVINVRFVLWVLFLVLSMVPMSPIVIIVWIAVFVFFNAVPELIYLGRYGTTDLLVESYRFVSENWITWFPANLVLLVASVALIRVVGEIPGALGQTVLILALAIMLAVALTVRGVLFLELTQSSRRARAFRRATGT